MKNERIAISIQERLERAAESRAASPRAAIMRLCGIYKMRPDMRICKEREFYRYSELAAYIEELRTQKNWEAGPCRLIWGPEVNNMLFRTACSFLFHTEKHSRLENRYLEIALEDYLDALQMLHGFKMEDGIGRVDTARRKEYRAFKEAMLAMYQPDLSVRDLILKLTCSYMDYWAQIDRLEYILRCKEAVLRDWREIQEIDGQLTDRKREKLMDLQDEKAEIYRYYSQKADRYPNRKNPYELVLKKMENGGMLHRESYRPEIFLEEISRENDFPAFRQCMEKTLSQDALEEAVSEINNSVYLIERLLVHPYLDMGSSFIWGEYL